MKTGHRPGGEPAKTPLTNYERLVQAAQKHDEENLAGLLHEQCKSGGTGNWQHFILGLVVNARSSDSQEACTRIVLDCPRPPQPTDNSDFISSAMDKGASRGTVAALLSNGFKPSKEKMRRLYALIERGSYNHDMFCDEILLTSVKCFSEAMVRAITSPGARQDRSDFDQRLIAMAKDVAPSIQREITNRFIDVLATSEMLDHAALLKEHGGSKWLDMESARKHLEMKMGVSVALNSAPSAAQSKLHSAIQAMGLQNETASPQLPSRRTRL